MSALAVTIVCSIALALGAALGSAFGWWLKRMADRLDRVVEELAAAKVEVANLKTQLNGVEGKLDRLLGTQ